MTIVAREVIKPEGFPEDKLARVKELGIKLTRLADKYDEEPEVYWSAIVSFVFSACLKTSDPMGCAVNLGNDLQLAIRQAFKN